MALGAHSAARSHCSGSCAKRRGRSSAGARPLGQGPPLGQAWASAARQGFEAACGGLHPCHCCHYSAQSHGPLLVSVA